jgi:hypothetical protein
VAAYAVVQAEAHEIKALRLRPDPQGEALPAAALKHSAEQSVAGLAAVYRAMHSIGWTARRCSSWGIVAAPRFLGRAEMVTALDKFATEGAWGISPHLIPHFSLHAVSGTLSQMLKISGPNFGVGGGVDGAFEAFRAAFAMLEDRSVPGFWLVLSGYVPELVPGISKPTRCAALALALTPIEAPERDGITLHLAGPVHDSTMPLSLEALLAAFDSPGQIAPQTWAAAGQSLILVNRIDREIDP